MIDKHILDSVKLVQRENLGSVSLTEQVIATAVDQGSQGWGVDRGTSVILRLADELRVAEELAGKYDETHRQLKGLQMENGRLRKSLDESALLAEEIEHNRFRIRELETELSNAKDQLKVAKERLNVLDKPE